MKFYDTITNLQRSCGKVMCSQVYVCLSTGEGVPMMHWTLMYTPRLACLSDMRLDPLALTPAPC